MENFLLNNLNIPLENKTIIVAVSTGVDSMVLLYSFLEMRKQYNLNLIVAHINHGKRVASTEEELFLKQFCLDNELIFEVLHLDPHQFDNDNFQKAAREKRYEFFLKLMVKYNGDYLGLAHHANDNMETILMRMIRGSSLDGYAGMRIISQYKGYTIIRPFLTKLKSDLIAYAKENNIKYFEDESNSQSMYTRNRVRKSIIPEILNESSEAYLKFYEFSSNLHQASDCINVFRDSFIKEHIEETEEYQSFKISEFNKNPQYLKLEILFEILKSYNLSKNNVLELLKIIDSPKPNIISDIKNELSVIKEYDKFMVLKEKPEIYDVDILITQEGVYHLNDTIDIIVTKKVSNLITNSNELWYNTSMLPLRVRSRRDGDKIKLSNGYKKVKDLLIDLKVGILDRQRALLLVNRDDEVLAVFGYAKSAILKASKNNNIIIKIQEKNNA